MLGWLAGLAAGAAHALSGPDHLAAVAPLALDAPRDSWRLGLRWGAGHSCAVAALGTLALVARGSIDLASLSGYAERLAGLALVGVGVWGWRRALSRFVHVHEHEHDGIHHRHVHLHAAGVREPHHGEHRHQHLAFGFGLLHGAGGATHLLGVLPALLLPGRAQALAYVACFALGTMVAMAGLGALVGSLAGSAGGRAHACRWMLGAAASVSVAIGAFWIFT